VRSAVLAPLLETPLNPSTPIPLTPRERDVLQLAADDLSAPGIAQHLSLSPATVNTHFGHIYVKLDVNSRAGAVAKGMRLGLIR
jgi:two-component system, NarL family, nitrate/nitrite response regulator NarL